MKIRSIWAHTLPFSFDYGPDDFERPIELGPHLTLIRGDNGCGKTVLAELISLLGHASIIPHREKHQEIGSPLVRLEVYLTRNDVEALRAMKSFLDDPDMREFRLGGRARPISKPQRQIINDAFRHIDLSSVPATFWESSSDNLLVTVEFRRWSSDDGDARHTDLKKILADEELLKSKLTFCAYSEDEAGVSDYAAILAALVAWNRPRLEKRVKAEGAQESAEPDYWTITPRFILTEAGLSPFAGKADLTFPGAVGYVNTDMYDFGAGLDIRESPKELREKMSDLLIDRLQILSGCGEITKPPISGAIPDGPPDFSLERGAIIESRWEKVFGQGHALKTGRARRMGPGKFTWSNANADLVEFVSSGENQAFFLLAYLENLHWRDSILVIDEPEIHLSLVAASKLMKQIMDIAAERGTQVIVVSHLPNLYRDRIITEYDWAKLSADPAKIHMINLQRENAQILVKSAREAMLSASRRSHEQVLDLVNDFKVEEKAELKIFGSTGRSLTALWNIFYRKIRRDPKRAAKS